jgi:hypothetical protein
MLHRSQYYDRRFLPAIVAGLVLALAGCTTEPAEPEPIRAGESLRSFGYIQYYKEPPYSRDDPVYPLTACQLAANGQSIVIADIAAEYTVIRRREDCSGPYGTFALSIPLRVVGVAAGPPIPRTVDLIAVGGVGEQNPEAGETWLFGMRMLDGQWHLTGHSRLEFRDEPIGPQRDVELPDTFEELSVETSARLVDFDEVCSADRRRRTSDEAFRELIHDADFWGCTPTGPNVPPVTPCDGIGEILTECDAPASEVQTAVDACNDRVAAIYERGHSGFLQCLETLARRSCTPPTDHHDECDPSPTGACGRLSAHVAENDGEASGYQWGLECQRRLAALDEAEQGEAVDCLIALPIDEVISGYWDVCLDG